MPSQNMGISIRTCCILVLALCCAFPCFAEEQQTLPSAVYVVGKVFCDTCFNQEPSKSSHFISGASVAVECRTGATQLTFRKEVKTNRHGVFRVRLPRRVVGRDFGEIKGCSVNLISSNEPFCSVASSATSSELRLKAKRNGLHVFSAGFFTFKPLKQPEFCNQEPKPVAERKQVQPAFFFFPPPIPFLPSPPNIGGVPLPPNPLQPPPSIFPPIFPSPPSIFPPIFPSPPSIFPPIFPSPPPSVLPPILPPVPFFTPPPPPPASIFPPFPIPLPPNPLFPGNPPATPAATTSP